MFALAGCFVDRGSVAGEASTGTTGAPPGPTTGAPGSSGDAGSSTGDATSGAATDTGCAPREYYRDGDGDGVGVGGSVLVACEPPAGYVEVAGDCDDGDAQVSPQVQELCDARDNDCDLAIDEYSPDNLECGGCTMAPYGAQVLHYCAALHSFKEARVLCMGRGADLVVIHDAALNTALATALAKLEDPAGQLWWIGLADEVVEGDFGWIDGSDDDFTAWLEGEPNDFEGGEDCTTIVNGTGGLWSDRPCADKHKYVCAGPA